MREASRVATHYEHVTTVTMLVRNDH